MINMPRRRLDRVKGEGDMKSFYEFVQILKENDQAGSMADLERPIKPGDKWVPPPPMPFDLNSFFKYMGRNNNGAFPEIICDDGFSMSVQAGKNYYSDPREDNSAYGGGYKSVEVSPSGRESLLAPFRSTDGDVYPFVPVEVVEEIVMKHKGLDHVAVQRGDKDWRSKMSRR
jgi:hypothetical protein